MSRGDGRISTDRRWPTPDATPAPPSGPLASLLLVVVYCSLIFQKNVFVLFKYTVFNFTELPLLTEGLGGRVGDAVTADRWLLQDGSPYCGDPGAPETHVLTL